MTEKSLLVADVGGTKTVLALYPAEPPIDAARPLRELTLPSRDYPSFEAALTALELTQPVVAACIGVAGPVVEGRCDATNLPWSLDENEISVSTGIARVELLNDLHASALGMLQLDADDRLPLNPEGRDVDGNIAVVAAGTGLGEAILFWDGATHQVIATEGGHCDFAPNSALEDELLHFLRDEYAGHVSYERLVSGPGVHAIYRFLRQQSELKESSELATALKEAQDPGALIGEWALKHGDPLATRTLTLFAQLYGREAGNLALKSLSRGGVLIGGGIAPKIVPILKQGGFLEGFLDKGRFTPLLRRMRVEVVLNPKTPIIGALHRAMALADENADQ